MQIVSNPYRTNHLGQNLTYKNTAEKARTTYIYQFNGMEVDNEVKGKGNSYDFGARMYDSRLGRWLTIDPLASKYPDLSPYNFVGNSPIIFVDYDGKDFGISINHSTKTIVITATFYSINEKTQEEADKAANNWNKLNNSTITIGGETYTVAVSINAKMAEGSSTKERFNNAQNNSELDGNTYNGSVNGFSGDKNFGNTEGRALLKSDRKLGKPLESGLSDGRNITMPLYNLEGNGIPFYGPRDHNYSVEHEMGHNLGLDDPGGKYYSPGGAMDYDGPYTPNIGDLQNVIKYALDGGGGLSKAHVTNTAAVSSPEDYKKLNSSDVGK